MAGTSLAVIMVVALLSLLLFAAEVDEEDGVVSSTADMYGGVITCRVEKETMRFFSEADTPKGGVFAKQDPLVLVLMCRAQRW